MPLVIKKYSNRRLYDTEESRYITLEELTARIRAGADVRVVDAKTGEDLTQATLTQLILEGPAARLLPVPLLTQLVRMQDDALGEFFGRYVSATLELYLAAKQGAQAVSPYFPFATLPFNASSALARLLTPQGASHQGASAAEGPPARERARRAPAASSPGAGASRAERAGGEPEPPVESDIAALRRELDELKRSLVKKKPRKR
jgi:polyhydroxyalkanoate synthesis repressor PhaR